MKSAYIDIFYDKTTFKLWVVCLREKETDYQIGNCDYASTKKLAIKYGDEMLKEYKGNI